MYLRAYKPEDWSRICVIHDAARLNELNVSGLKDAFLTLEETAEGEGLFDGSLVVAEIDGVVQGFVAFSEGELNWLYVNPVLSRRGIGRELLRYAIRESGGTLSTEVLVGNEAALQLYLSEGFKVIRRVDGRLTGNESFAASGFLLHLPKIAV